MLIILALFMALIHVYVFVLESLLWSRPKTAKVFGMNAERMEANKLMAFNQGFYNLFLAIALIVGAYLSTHERPVEGLVLMDYAALSIAGAGIVLFARAPKLYRPALIQIVPAVIYFITRLVG